MALDFFAGCVGGAAGVIVGHPLDTVKVRLQTQSPTNIKYRGTFHCLTTIVKKESVTGLYKGISSPLLGVAGVNALIFGVYGTLRPYVSGSPGNDALWAHFAAGAVSGAVQSVIASPMELVKTRLQINEDRVGQKKLGPVEVLKGIYQNEGGLRRGVFKGWGITLGREIPGFGVYFASYEAMTRFGDGEVGTLGMLFAGGMAGVLSWIVTFPIDVVKTRLQCDDRGKYNGAFDCARKTYLSEGYRAFSRGLVSTVIRAFPTNAATFTVVTWIMRLAGESPVDDTQDCRKYLDELLKETSRLQDKIEDSLRLKVPHYFCGNSLTSCSLASMCASSAQKYADRTQIYFNFYQSLQQTRKMGNEEDDEEDVGVDKQRVLHDKLVELRFTTNTQEAQNPSISSRSSRNDNETSHHNRNGDIAVLHNNHIPFTSSASSESCSERETHASPVNTISCSEKIESSSETEEQRSSLIQQNKVFSHELTSFPVRMKTLADDSINANAAVSSDDNSDTQRNANEMSSDATRSLSPGDLAYLSKSLDLPVHILEAAAFQQRLSNASRSTMNDSIRITQTITSPQPVVKTPASYTSSRSNNNTSITEAWRKYYKTSAVNLCKCFEDHCVCYL